MAGAVQLFRGHDRNVDRLVRAHGRLEVPGACSPCHVPARLIAPHCPGENACDEVGRSLDQSGRALRPLVRSCCRLEGYRPRVVQGCHRTCQECVIVVHRRQTDPFFFATGVDGHRPIDQEEPF